MIFYQSNLNVKLAGEAVNETAPCAIPRVARLVFAAKRLDKFIKSRALPLKVRLCTVATHVRRVIPQGGWSRWSVCRDGKYPDFKAFVFDLVPHGSLHPDFEEILA
jgi:hypothetical protein